MKRTRRTKKRKSYFWYYVSSGFLFFLISGIASYFYFKPMLAFEAPFIEDIQSQRLEGNSDHQEKEGLRLYSSQKRVFTSREKSQRGAYLFIAEDVIKKLIEPYGVKLRDLYMDREGTIYADFSSELKNNFHGDASEEYSIISELYKRLKANVPSFTALKLLIEGKEMESFGGHIVISRPIVENIKDVKRDKTDRYF
jgi:hypothetical protein